MVWNFCVHKSNKLTFSPCNKRFCGNVTRVEIIANFQKGLIFSPKILWTIIIEIKSENQKLAGFRKKKYEKIAKMSNDMNGWSRDVGWPLILTRTCNYNFYYYIFKNLKKTMLLLTIVCFLSSCISFIFGILSSQRQRQQML